MNLKLTQAVPLELNGIFKNQLEANHYIKHLFFRQVVEKKLPDIREQLCVNHCFLSFFVSAGLMTMRHVDQIMQVSGEFTSARTYCVSNLSFVYKKRSESYILL